MMDNLPARCAQAGIFIYINGLHGFQSLFSLLQFVLFGFRPDLALHTARLVSNHSYCYVSSPDQSVCFASSALNPLSACNAQAGESFMQYAG